MTDSLTSQKVLRVLLAQQRALERIADALERAYPKPTPSQPPTSRDVAALIEASLPRHLDEDPSEFNPSTRGF